MCVAYLLKALGTYKVFEYNTHIMHRQVTGPINGDFHARMQEHYSYAEDVMDTIAERTRQLGSEIPLKMCDLVNMSHLNFLTSTPDMQSAIDIAIKLNGHMVDFLKEGIKMTQDMDDYHSEDLLRGFCAWHEVQKWKLESLKSKSLSTDPLKKDGEQKMDADGDKDD